MCLFKNSVKLSCFCYVAHQSLHSPSLSLNRTSIMLYSIFFFIFFVIIEKNINTHPHKPVMTKWENSYGSMKAHTRCPQVRSFLCLMKQAAVCLVCLRERLYCMPRLPSQKREMTSFQQSVRVSYSSSFQRRDECGCLYITAQCLFQRKRMCASSQSGDQ